MSLVYRSYGASVVEFRLEGIEYTAVRENGEMALYTDKTITPGQYKASQLFAENIFREMDTSLSHTIAELRRKRKCVSDSSDRP